MDSGASTSLISMDLLPGVEHKSKAVGTINGIGGKQIVGEPLKCDIVFRSGLEASHGLKPTNFPNNPGLVILGTDFMEKFGATKFDWDKGVIKLGDEWVYCTMENKLDCTFGPELSNDEVSILKSLTIDFKDVFAINPKAPRECKDTKHHILTETDRVCFDKPRRTPNKWLGNVEQQVQEMLDNDIIEESVSPYNSNIILVDKKDGSKRFVIDYRSLNKTTMKDAYPLPNVDELIESCRGAKYFTQLDLAAAFWCIPIEEKDRPKTAFSTPRGRYQCKRMPYGLKNSSPTFQRKMDKLVDNVKKKMVLRTMPDEAGVGAFIDNVFIFSETFEDHVSIILLVFNEMREMELSLRADKCEFAFRKVEFLGYVLDGITISPSPSNILKVKQFPKPHNKKAIQRFMGLVNFNRRFIRHFAEISRPLTTLLSDKVAFLWGDEQDKAFELLRNILSQVDSLFLPDWNRPFHIQSDASGIAVGGMLYQLSDEDETRTVSYHSKTLTGAESRWSATERELFAIISCKQKWKVYCNDKIIFHTDHEPLKNIRHQKDPRGKIMRWLLLLEGVDYEILYIPGKDNIVADALSRVIIPTDNKTEGRDVESEIDDYIFAEFLEEESNVLIKAQQDDKWVKKTVGRIKNGKKISKGPYKNTAHLMMNEMGLLCKGKRIVIPPNLQEKIIQDYHCSSHPGAEITSGLIRTRFWWRSITAKVEAFVKDCRTCIQTKAKPHKAEMQMTEVPKPGEIIAMDHASMPPTSEGNTGFLLVVDVCTKLITATAIPNQTADVLRSVLWSRWYAYFGIPLVLLSDQAKNMDGTIIRLLCDELAIEKRHSSPYHPQGNGHAERAIELLKDRIRAMILAKSMIVTEWDQILPQAVLEANSQINKSLKFSPFVCTFGREPRLTQDNVYKLPEAELGLSAEETVKIANMNRYEAKLSYKKQHDKTSSADQSGFEIGDRVLVKRNFGAYKKISVKWLDGPFYIYEQVGEVNWRIVDRNGKTKVYHRNGLMRAGQRKEPAVRPPPAADDPGTWVNNPVCNSPIIILDTPQVHRPSVINPEEENTQTETLDATLKSTLDISGFKDNVLTDSSEDVLKHLTDQHPTPPMAPTPPTPPALPMPPTPTPPRPPPTATRSGRVPIPVKRLIDQM